MCLWLKEGCDTIFRLVGESFEGASTGEPALLSWIMDDLMVSCDDFYCAIEPLVAATHITCLVSQHL